MEILKLFVIGLLLLSMIFLIWYMMKALNISFKKNQTFQKDIEENIVAKFEENQTVVEENSLETFLSKSDDKNIIEKTKEVEKIKQQIIHNPNEKNEFEIDYIMLSYLLKNWDKKVIPNEDGKIVIVNEALREVPHLKKIKTKVNVQLKNEKDSQQNDKPIPDEKQEDISQLDDFKKPSVISQTDFSNLTQKQNISSQDSNIQNVMPRIKITVQDEGQKYSSDDEKLKSNLDTNNHIISSIESLLAQKQKRR